MPIYRLLGESAFDPETVKAMTTAFEDVLRQLDLVDRSDPLTDIVARKIIEIGRRGERDPARIRELAVQELRR